MGSIASLFASAFRDFVTDGVPSSGLHEPPKSEIRRIGTLIEAALAAQNLGSVDITHATRAAINADLMHPENAVGLVYADATDANNDLYAKVGASGSGSWTLTTIIHGVFANILASDPTATAGVSTSKAITVKQRADLEKLHDEDLGKFFWQADGMLPSATKDNRVYIMEPGVRIIVDCRPHNDHYRGGNVRRYDDLVRYEMFNIAERWHGLPPGSHIWVINSIWARFKGLWAPHVNFSFNTLDGGNTNTGQLPSTFEPVQFVGNSTDTIAAINAGGGSGPYHGNIGYNSFSLSPDGGPSIRDTMAAFDVIECESLVFDDSWTYKSPDGTPLIAVNGARTFNPSSGNQLGMSMNLAYNSTASQTTFGYAAMMPLRLANRLQSRHDTTGGGGVSAVHTVGVGDGSLKALGRAVRVTGWHTDQPGNCCELSLIDGLSPFRRDGVRDDYADEALALDQAAGPKVYIPTHAASLDSDVETNKTLAINVFYNGVSANGA